MADESTNEASNPTIRATPCGSYPATVCSATNLFEEVTSPLPENQGYRPTPELRIVEWKWHGAQGCIQKTIQRWVSPLVGCPALWKELKRETIYFVSPDDLQNPTVDPRPTGKGEKE